MYHRYSCGSESSTEIRHRYRSRHGVSPHYGTCHTQPDTHQQTCHGRLQRINYSTHKQIYVFCLTRNYLFFIEPFFRTLIESSVHQQFVKLTLYMFMIKEVTYGNMLPITDVTFFKIMIYMYVIWE